MVAGHAWAQAVDSRRSGFDFMSAATQALQRDDAQNPVMLWVSDGARRWRDASAGRACTDCHGVAEQSMRGVAARYPAWDDRLGEPVNLQKRINLCRERHQAQPPLNSEEDAMLALESYVAMQSRGVPIARPDDPRLADSLERGEQALHDPYWAAGIVVRALPRPARGRPVGGKPDSPGASHRVPDLSSAVAISRVARATPARLLCRRARRAAWFDEPRDDRA